MISGVRSSQDSWSLPRMSPHPSAGSGPNNTDLWNTTLVIAILIVCDSGLERIRHNIPSEYIDSDGAKVLSHLSDSSGFAFHGGAFVGPIYLIQRSSHVIVEFGIINKLQKMQARAASVSYFFC